MTIRRPDRPRQRRWPTAIRASAALLAIGSGYLAQQGALPVDLGRARLSAAAQPADDFHPAADGLVFSDEFNGSSLDRSAWCTRYQYGGGAALQPGYTDQACTKDGGGTSDVLNDEQQRYRDLNSAGAALHVVKGGVLSLTATKTGKDAKAPFESAMIRSKQEFVPTAKTSYYLTSRVKLPDALGSWPAFWLTPGMRNGASQWPPELDIFEGALNGDGDNTNMLHVGTIGKSQSGSGTYDGPGYSGGYYRAPGSIRNQWLEVGFAWTTSSVCWFVNGVKLHCQGYSWKDDSGHPANPSPILLNLAIGGAWAGRGGIESAKFPITFDVDHVRVYSSSAAPGPVPPSSPPSPAPSSTPPSSTPSSAPTGPAVPVPAGAGASMLRSPASGLCLTPGRSTGKTATIQNCGPATWSYSSGGELLYGAKCLDAMGAATRNGTPVATWTCHRGSNQKWTRKADGSFVGVQSGRCLDVDGQHTATGTRIQLWDCNGQANQKWMPEGVSPAPPATGPGTPASSNPATSTPGSPAGAPSSSAPATPSGPAGLRAARSGVGYADARSWGQWRGQPVSSIDTWNDAAQNGKITWASMLPLFTMKDVVAKLPALNQDLRASTGDPGASVAVSVAQPMFASGDSYSSCASGSSPSEGQLDAMAAAIANLAPGRSAFVRLGWEFNSNYLWKAGEQDGARFVACWKRWHRALKVASPGLKLVWNPNSDMSWTFPLDRFWPGKEYVDAAGPDIYAKADKGRLSSPDQWTGGFKDYTGAAVSNPRGINAWTSYIAAKGVPLAVPEWGVQNDGNAWASADPAFITQLRSAFARAAASPAGLAYEDYFDAGPDPGFDCKHSLHHPSCSKNSQAAARYQALWGTRYVTT